MLGPFYSISGTVSIHSCIHSCSLNPASYLNGPNTKFRAHLGPNRFHCRYRRRRDRVAVPIRKSLLTFSGLEWFSSRFRLMLQLFDPYPANHSPGQPGRNPSPPGVGLGPGKRPGVQSAPRYATVFFLQPPAP